MFVLGNIRAFAQMPSQTPGDLQQLVAPIALYPDELVTEILAASTYPRQIVQADRWLQQNSGLQGEQLAAAVDQQPWDPSVKALTEFPSVVSNMDRNLSWTTSLGEAYVNDQQDVLDAVQVMRRRAEDAGNLQTTPQQRVITEGSTIVIEPAVADTYYLPAYDPWVVYGAPIPAYPGYFYDPWYGGPYIAFGRGIHLGFFGGFGLGFRSYPRFGYGYRSFGGTHAIRGFRGGDFRGRGFGGFRARGFGGRGFGGRGFGGFGRRH